MNDKVHLLLIDDEKNYLLVLETLLTEAGYAVTALNDPETALAFLEESEVDIVITDMKMPRISGREVLERVKKNWPHIPVLIMTAFGSIESAVEAMKYGAFDYITKPFGTGELLARVRAALRTNRYSSNPTGTFRAQDLTINYERRKVFVGEEEIKLTQTEYNIVAFLSEHAGRVMTYPAIVKAIWGDTDCGSTKKLQVNMANIRRKLGSRPGKNTYILNELGVGYRMIDEDRDSHTEEDT